MNRLITTARIHLLNLWGIVSLWSPILGLIWWWNHYPPIFQSGPYEGGLNWPLFALFFLACLCQFFRLMWAWLRS